MEKDSQIKVILTVIKKLSVVKKYLDIFVHTAITSRLGVTLSERTYYSDTRMLTQPNPAVLRVSLIWPVSPLTSDTKRVITTCLVKRNERFSLRNSCSENAIVFRIHSLKKVFEVKLFRPRLSRQWTTIKNLKLKQNTSVEN